jgi:hypothetical protein
MQIKSIPEFLASQVADYRATAAQARELSKDATQSPSHRALAREVSEICEEKARRIESGLAARLGSRGGNNKPGRARLDGRLPNGAGRLPKSESCSAMVKRILAR